MQDYVENLTCEHAWLYITSNLKLSTISSIHMIRNILPSISIYKSKLQRQCTHYLVTYGALQLLDPITFLQGTIFIHNISE